MHARRIIALSLDVLERAANLLIESDNAVSRFDKRLPNGDARGPAALDLFKTTRWIGLSARERGQTFSIPFDSIRRRDVPISGHSLVSAAIGF